jgi:hypothetical protein
MRGLKKYGLAGLGMLALVVVVLLVTGWGSAAAAQITSVFVTNDAAHAVPVNVTNSSLSVASAAPITSGGGFAVHNCGDTFPPFSPAITATALSIHMQSNVIALRLVNGTNEAASFIGPAAEIGNAEIVLALARPIKFDNITCVQVPDAVTDQNYSVSWVGDQP